MTNIKKVIQNKADNMVHYFVIYKNGRIFRYTEKDNLPNTVLRFILVEATAETTYFEGTSKTVYTA